MLKFNKPEYEKPEEVLEADPPENMTPHNPARMLGDDEHESHEDHEAKKGYQSSPVAVPCVPHKEKLEI